MQTTQAGQEAMTSESSSAVRPHAVVLERLSSALREAAQRPVVWLAGPAGTGKTTLINSYLQAQGSAHLKLSLTLHKGGAAFLATRLKILLENAGILAKSRYDSLAVQAIDPTSEIVCLLQSLSVDCLYVVLEDYHSVERDYELASCLTSIIEQLPAHIKIFISSRRQPPSLFARNLIHGNIALLDGAELFYRDYEWQRILEEQDTPYFLLGAPLQHRLQLIAGWPAGVHWIANLLVEDPTSNDEQLVKNIDEAFENYFAQEVLDTASPSMLRAMLRSSPLLRFSPHELTEFSLLGEVEARAFCEGQIPFTTLCTGHDRVGYQEFLPWFRRALFSRLTTSASVKLSSDELRRIGDYLRANNEWEAALDCYIESSGWEQAVVLAETVCGELLAEGNAYQALQYLDRLPHLQTVARPYTCYLHGKALLRYNPVSGRALLERAYEISTRDEDPMLAFACVATIIESYLTQHGSLSLVGDWLKLLAQLHTPDVNSQIHDWPDVLRTLRIALRLFPDHRRQFKSLPQMEMDPQRAPKTAIEVYCALFNDEFYNLAYSSWRLQLNVSKIRLMLVRVQHTGSFAIAAKATLRRAESQLAEGRYHEALELLDLLEQFEISSHSQLLIEYRVLRAVIESRHLKMDGLFPVLEWAGFLAESLQAHYLVAKISLLRAFSYIEHDQDSLALSSLEMCKSLCYKLDSPMLNLHYALARVSADKSNLAQLNIALELGEKHQLIPNYWISREILIELINRALQEQIAEQYSAAVVRQLNLVPSNPAAVTERWPWRVRIYTFGRFSVLLDDVSLATIGKAQQKPLLLLKAIIALGGRNIAESVLSDALWPGVDRDSAYRTLTTNLHRLRKLLQFEDVIEVNGGHVSLNPRLCWVDCWSFERVVSQCDKLSKRKTEALNAKRYSESVLRLYRGGFLRNEKSTDWMQSHSQRLLGKFCRTICELSEILQKLGNEREAVALCQKALEIEPGNSVLQSSLDLLLNKQSALPS